MTTTLVALAAFAFLVALGRGPIATSHEARVAATALTMVDSGLPWSARPIEVTTQTPASSTTYSVNPWFIPVFEGRIRLQKPPLPYWVAAASFFAVNRGETGARMIPALMGLLGIGLIYVLTKELAGRRSALWAVAVWAGTFFIVDEYRKVMSDPYLAFFTLLGVALWVRLCGTDDPRRFADPAQSAESSRWRDWLATGFYLTIALGLLSKGPVILAHVAIPIGVFWIIYRRRPNLRWAPHLVGIALLLAVCLPWPVYVIRRIPNVLDMWRYESVGEFADTRDNKRGWYFYLGSLFQITFPWTPAFVGGVVLAVMRRRRRPDVSEPAPPALPRVAGSAATLRFALLWCAIMVVFFSFVHMKKNAYLLPIMPACVILAARALAIASAWNRRRYRWRWPAHVLVIQQLIVLGLGLAIAALLLLGPIPGIRRAINDGSLLTLATGRLPAYGLLVMLALLATAAALFLRRRSFDRKFFAQACCCSILIALWAGYVESDKAIFRGPDVDFTPKSAAIAAPPPNR